MTAWKSASDPSPGDLIFGLENVGLPQVVLRKGSKKRFRTGAWNGLRFSGASSATTRVFTSLFVDNSEELYYMFEFSENSVLTRVTVNQSGFAQRLVLDGSSQWVVMYTSPNNMWG